MSVILRGKLANDIQIIAYDGHYQILYHDAEYILYGVLPQPCHPSVIIAIARERYFGIMAAHVLS